MPFFLYLLRCLFFLNEENERSWVRPAGARVLNEVL